MPKKERFTFKGIVYPEHILGERNFYSSSNTSDGNQSEHFYEWLSIFCYKKRLLQIMNSGLKGHSS